MSKVTGKLQLTLPKHLADQYGIAVGDDVAVVAAGASIAIVPPRAAARADTTDRLRHFDEAVARQRARERGPRRKPSTSRGWKREDLYTRGRAR